MKLWEVSENNVHKGKVPIISIENRKQCGCINQIISKKFMEELTVKCQGVDCYDCRLLDMEKVWEMIHERDEPTFL